jgi:predicted AlkP superfamily phosphohydrolase/phosphomutase
VQELLIHSRGISDVKLRDEIYWGPYVGRAPDIMIFVDHKRGYKLGSSKVMARTHDDIRRSDHHPHGIVSFLGEGFSPVGLGVVNSWDVAPTIMSYMGLAIPNDADGRSLIDFRDRNCRSYDYTTQWQKIKSRSMLSKNDNDGNSILSQKPYADL